MARYFRTLSTLVSALTLATLSLHAAAPSQPPSVAAAGIAALRDKPGKPKKLDRTFGNGTVRMVTSKAKRTTHCIGADLGHFAILTSYDCVGEWWNDKTGVSVSYSTYSYKTSYGQFVRAFRGLLEADDRWAVLETDGHTNPSFGYYDLDSDIHLDQKTFTFVGLSPKVEDGKQPAMQPNCHLRRDGPGEYASDCGGDFSETGFLIVEPADPGKPGRYVGGLARVIGTSKVAKRQIYTLDVASVRLFGKTVEKLRENQDSRYQQLVAQRMEAARRNQANHNYDRDVDVPRRRTGPSASQIVLDGLRQIADTVSNKTPLNPQTYTSNATATTAVRPAPSAPPASAGCNLRVNASMPAVTKAGKGSNDRTFVDYDIAVPGEGGAIDLRLSAEPGCVWTLIKLTDGGHASGWISSDASTGGAGQGPRYPVPGVLRISVAPFRSAGALPSSYRFGTATISAFRPDSNVTYVSVVNFLQCDPAFTYQACYGKYGKDVPLGIVIR